VTTRAWDYNKVNFMDLPSGITIALFVFSNTNIIQTCVNFRSRSPGYSIPVFLPNFLLLNLTESADEETGMSDRSQSPIERPFTTTFTCIGKVKGGRGRRCLLRHNRSWRDQEDQLWTLSDMRIDELRSTSGRRRICSFLYTLARYTVCTFHESQCDDIVQGWITNMEIEAQTLRELDGLLTVTAAQVRAARPEQDRASHPEGLFDRPQFLPTPFRPTEVRSSCPTICSLMHVPRCPIAAECPICKDPMQSASLWDMTWCKSMCGQSFHFKCIRSCLRQKATCPCCRSPWSRRCPHNTSTQPAAAEPPTEEQGQSIQTLRNHTNARLQNVHHTDDDTRRVPGSIDRTAILGNLQASSPSTRHQNTIDRHGVPGSTDRTTIPENLQVPNTNSTVPLTKVRRTVRVRLVIEQRMLECKRLQHWEAVKIRIEADQEIPDTVKAIYREEIGQLLDGQKRKVDGYTQMIAALQERERRLANQSQGRDNGGN
jgi:hypothetical protein